MSIETSLVASLKSLVGNRISPLIFRESPAVPVWPAIRYTIISEVPFEDLCGDGDDSTSGDPDETNELHVQLDIVAEKYQTARALRASVRSVMMDFDPPAILEGSSSQYDEETKTYREIMEYRFDGSSSS